MLVRSPILTYIFSRSVSIKLRRKIRSVGITKVRTHLRMVKSASEHVHFCVVGRSHRASDHAALACRTKSLLNKLIRNAITLCTSYTRAEKEWKNICRPKIVKRIANYSLRYERSVVTALPAQSEVFFDNKLEILDIEKTSCSL